MEYTYEIKYRRFGFWRTIKGCTGHKLNEFSDSLWVTLDKDRGGTTILRYSKTKIKLGNDWIRYIKEQERIHRENEAAIAKIEKRT